MFKLTMEFSEDYPNKAPVVKFKTRMFHPNSEWKKREVASEKESASRRGSRLLVLF